MGFFLFRFICKLRIPEVSDIIAGKDVFRIFHVSLEPLTKNSRKKAAQIRFARAYRVIENQRNPTVPLP